MDKKAYFIVQNFSGSTHDFVVFQAMYAPRHRSVKVWKQAKMTYEKLYTGQDDVMRTGEVIKKPLWRQREQIELIFMFIIWDAIIKIIYVITL